VTTTRDLIQAGSERLRASGSDTPRLDAEVLLAYAIGVDRTAVVAHGDAPVGPGAESSYLGFIDRRATGEPIAYIRGFREFHGIVIVVDSRALIPRPETEALVDRALVEIMARLTRGPVAAVGVVGRCRVIDVGTGSGAIAVALAVGLRKRGVPPDEVTIVAVDVSPDALDLARENAVGHGVGDRILVESADLLPPRSPSEPWDVVVANLPYVRSDALAVAPDPTAFEPALALDGGPDGLEVIGRLLERLTTTLSIDGVALLEIGADQGDAIGRLVNQRLPSWSCTVVPDLAGLPPMAVLRRPAS
jgi:release factor glutamine methyltransferase